MDKVICRLKEIDKMSLLMFFIVINAPLDLLVSVSRRFIQLNLSPATVFRGLTFGFSFLYIVYLVIQDKWEFKLKNSKINALILIATIVINLLFLITRNSGFGFKEYFMEINELIRFLYFPYLFLVFVNLDIKNANILEVTIIRGMKTLIGIYSFCIVFPFITNTGFNTYTIEYLEGNVGWLYGANEIGMIIGLLINVFIIDIKRKTLTTKDYVLILLAIFAIAILGTKGALLFLVSFIIQVIFICTRKTNYKAFIRKRWGYLLVAFLVLVFLISLIPAVNNITKILADRSPSEYFEVLLSGRITFLDIAWNQYIAAPLSNKLTGIGVLIKGSSGTFSYSKLIEMDLFELFIRYGIVNMIIVYSPFVYLIKKIRDNIELYKQDLIVRLLTFTLILSFILSFLIGHVVSTPSVSFVVILIIVLVINRMSNFNHNINCEYQKDKLTNMIEPLKKVIVKDEKSFISDLQRSMKSKNKHAVVTANAEILMAATRDDVLQKELLSSNTLITADGIGTKVAVSIITKNEASKITGVSIVEQLIDGLQQEQKLFVYGSQQSVLDAFGQILNSSHKTNYKLFNGYDYEQDYIKEEIKSYKPSLILVCLGVPRQESFIFDIMPEVESGLFIGCGGSIDVLSGTKKRAPELIQKFHMEWLYRILKEPSRFRRFYDSNIKFIFVVLKLKINTILKKEHN